MQHSRIETVSNITLSLLRERADLAAAEQKLGNYHLGTGQILAVATLIEGIRANVFRWKLGNGERVFGVNHAIDCARLYFNRFDELCKIEDTREFKHYKNNKQIIAHKSDNKGSADEWAKYIINTIYRYEFKGMVLGDDYTASRKAVLKPYLKSDKETLVSKALDDIDYKRKMLREVWAYACLYIARDIDGALWMQSNVNLKEEGKKVKSFGIWINSHDFMPFGVTADLPNAPTLVKPLRGERVILTGKKRRDKDGSTEQTTVRVNFASFAAAWKLPIVQSDDTTWKQRFTQIGMLIDDKFDLPINARKAFDDALAKMIALSKRLPEVRPEGSKPVITAPTPRKVGKNAREIASKLPIGREPQGNTLKDGTPAPQLAS